MEKFKFLIIGGAGAIGSYLSRELAKMNHDVTVLDNLSSGHLELLDNKKIKFVHHDITRPIELEDDFEIIIHAAAFFANQNSVDHPIDDLMTNGIGMINTLEFSKKNKNLKKYIFFSSSCVYGNNYDQLETTPIGKLDTPYAITKYLGEKYCEYYHEHFKLPIIILRIFNSFGPGEYPGRYRNVIPNFINEILTLKRITITGTGEETRDFTSVKDIYQAVLLSITHGSSFDIFNVGSSKETTINTIADILSSFVIGNIVVIKTAKRDWDTVNRRKANTTKISNTLGYVSTTNLDKDLLETYQWHLENHSKRQNK